MIMTLLSSVLVSMTPLTKVEKLWEQVEKYKPVQPPYHQNVVSRPVHIDLGPDPHHKSVFQENILSASRIDHLHFPKFFSWGVATSAAQFEGAVKFDNRGPSVWDSFSHLIPDGMFNNETFDIATEFRLVYPLDIARVRAMGCHDFSFSVSWSRVIPMGMYCCM